MYLVTAQEMQLMDQSTIEDFGIPGRVLMENAGREATRIFLETFCEASHKRIGVIAGPGNNGGDGFVMARCLGQKGLGVTVYLLAERHRVRGDAAANLKLLTPLNIPVNEIYDEKSFLTHQAGMRHEHIWIDAIFGTGLAAEVQGFFKEIIAFINQLNRPVFSVDIPSGLHSDTGQPCGECIRAHATAAFAFAKLGHLLYPGADYTGKLEIADIGIPPHVADRIGPKQFLLTPPQIRNYFKPRPFTAHKGDTGHLLVVAGSPGKTGAAAMTALSAMRIGAGLVTLAIPAGLHPALETMVMETMTHPLPETPAGSLDPSAFGVIMGLLSGKKCLAIGPGIGISRGTATLVRRIIRETAVPLVIDADGLNCIAKSTQVLKKAGAAVILTPHPGEMSRLVDRPVKEIQADRVKHAREFSVKFNVHTVLKGARTLIAHPDGRVYVNPTGNSGMASGGMGDVLTGIISGLLTQGYAAEAAAHMGVFIHGACADALADRMGPFGFLATDVIHEIPAQIKKFTGP
ncbi:MAG: NAD(P)H-hydrate dehydratase [Desulfobacterales bacterium]|nr:NAD(P)H-hydrate dehydratase [Desulfobacterales bacterium]